MTLADERGSTGVRGVSEIGPGVYAVTSESPPRGRAARAWHRLHRLLVGPPLPSRRETRERLGWIAALAILGADSIASSVYGPEEMLRMLAQAGPAAVTGAAVPIAAAIVALLAILAVSYWQTIHAYPSGAGGYIVASDNLGRLAGLIGAAALLIDYTLDVAVSVASGMETITSAVPMLAPWRVVLGLAALCLIAVANLRGIRAAGALLSAPIYLYILGTLGVIGLGLVRWATGSLPAYTPPASSQEQLAQPTEALGLLLLLRAFSSGAVALTGIEAVSNGVPYFREPATRNAHRTLATLAVAFGGLFLGIGFLSGALGIIPDPDEVETVHSQLTRTLLGPGPLHVVLEASALLLLILAADTGFADFPRLLSLLARDGYLPTAFAQRGARLAFDNGILLVAAISGVLIVVFRGSVTALVPLFTVGAFLTFTLSQAGMARHWWRRHETGWHWRLAVNALGAAATSVVLVVVLVSKLLFGAWLVVIVLPLLVLLLRAIGQHHERVEQRVRVDSPRAAARALSWSRQHHVVIPVGEIDRSTLAAIAYARSLTSHAPGPTNGRADADQPAGIPSRPSGRDGDPTPGPVRMEAVHVTDDRHTGERLRQDWDALQTGVPLVILESPYRASAAALIRYLDLVQRRDGPRTEVTVIVAEVQPTHWWHALVHNYLAWRLKWVCLFRPGTVVISVPYTIRE